MKRPRFLCHAAQCSRTLDLDALPGCYVAPLKARNLIFVYGLFADGSCWSEMIVRLQTRDLNMTSVQIR